MVTTLHSFTASQCFVNIYIYIYIYIRVSGPPSLASFLHAAHASCLGSYGCFVCLEETCRHTQKKKSAQSSKLRVCCRSLSPAGLPIRPIRACTSKCTGLPLVKDQFNLHTIILFFCLSHTIILFLF